MTQSNQIRLLIADDHKVVRKGLKVFLSLFDEIELVGEAQNGQQAVDLCDNARPDVILMDLKMPVMDGVSATRLIRERYPATQVVMLTSHEEEGLVRQALEAGAISFLYKDADEDDLLSAIRLAHQGRSTLAPEAMQALVRETTSKPNAPTVEALTKREREILTLVAQGMTNPQIAEALVISPSTVHFHIHNTLAKLQAETRAEAVAIAIRNDLIQS